MGSRRAAPLCADGRTCTSEVQPPMLIIHLSLPCCPITQVFIPELKEVIDSRDCKFLESDTLIPKTGETCVMGLHDSNAVKLTGLCIVIRMITLPGSTLQTHR